MLAAAVGLTVGALTVGTGAAYAQKKEVVIAATGGTMERALVEHFYKPFEEATGIPVNKVTTELPSQWARVQANARTGRQQYDIVTATFPDLIQHRDQLVPIDCDRMPNMKRASPGACMPYGVMRSIGAMVMVWNTDMLKGRTPESWKDFYDVQGFPGPRGLPDTGDREYWVPVTALLADGVEKDKLFPLDLDRAYRKLDQIKPHVAVWWKSGDHVQQILRSGEVAMTMSYSGRALIMSRERPNVQMTFNQGIRDVGIWAVIKGGPNTEGAMTFLDFFMGGPERHVKFADQLNTATANLDALDLLPEAERRRRANHPDNWARQVVPDFEWIGANREKLRERWVAWLTR
ncbi:ABC transporter substrate-binding protein [Allostella vacuolata]|nr:ABC transporter substrate-binding protein [Stella vacuolata]